MLKRLAHSVPVIGFIAVFLLFPKMALAASLSPDWFRTFGGPSSESGNEVITDSEGNVYFLGSFNANDVDFDPGPEEDLHSSGGTGASFLSKYTADGDYLWTKTWNGYSTLMKLDKSGTKLYFQGMFYGEDLDFDPGPGEALLSIDGFNAQGYSLQLDLNGEFISVWKLAYDDSVDVRDFAINSAGEYYYIGNASQNPTNFNSRGGTDSQATSGLGSPFVTKLNADGSYDWSFVINGDDYDTFQYIGIDSEDKLNIAGQFRSQALDMDSGEGNAIVSAGTGKDIFIVQYDDEGSFNWVRTLEETGSADLYGFELDQAGRIYITGSYYDPDLDFDGTGGTDTFATDGNGDSFLTRYNNDGSYDWTKVLLFPETYEDSNEIAISDTYIFWAGYLDETGVYDMDPSDGEDIIEAESQTAFLSQYTLAGEYVSTAIAVSNADIAPSHWGMSATPTNVVFSGAFSGSNVHFANNTETRTSAGGNDIFLMSFSLEDGEDPEDEEPPTDNGNGNNNQNTSSGNSGSSSNKHDPNHCGNFKPVGVPDLFQIDRNGSTAKLHFTPVAGNVRTYSVIYGFHDGDERFGGISIPVMNENDGVQSLVVQDLDPKATYSFKVVPVNGCATGEWSNWLIAKPSASKTTLFYRYLPGFLQKAN